MAARGKSSSDGWAKWCVFVCGCRLSGVDMGVLCLILEMMRSRNGTLAFRCYYYCCCPASRISVACVDATFPKHGPSRAYREQPQHGWELIVAGISTTSYSSRPCFQIFFRKIQTTAVVCLSLPTASTSPLSYSLVYRPNVCLCSTRLE